MRLLVFASGSGSNFNAIAEAVYKKGLKAEIPALIVDRDCYAAERAKAFGIPVRKVNPRNETELLAAIKEYSPDYLILAGYMRIIPSSVINEYPLRIVNIHPSLLPSFPGVDAIGQAWRARVKVTGVTVHFVNDLMDQGPVLAQEPVKTTGFTDIKELETQIHRVEHRLYVETLRFLTEENFDTLVVSKCLLGENCRYDGESKYSARVAKIVSDFKGRVIKVCPELSAGFTVPRSRIELVKGRAIMDNTGDVTDRINTAVNSIMDSIGNAKSVLAILKEKSPSCGVTSPMGLLTSQLRTGFKNLAVSEKEI